MGAVLGFVPVTPFHALNQVSATEMTLTSDVPKECQEHK